MAYQIYAVSECYNQYGTFFIRCHTVNKGTNEIQQKIYGLNELPKVAIGPKYEADGSIENQEERGDFESVLFSNFSHGKITSLNKLPPITSKFEPEEKALNDAKYYLVNHEGTEYAFPCYELFRTFLAMDNRSLKLLFQYDSLESFIDNDYGGVRQTVRGTELTLDLNKSFPKSFLPRKMIEKFVLILYNPVIRSYWKSIQSQMMLGNTDFASLSFGFEKLGLKFQSKKLGGKIKLVYYITSILTKIPFPAEYIIINHPDLKSRKVSSKPNNEKGKEKGKQSFKIPISKDNEVSNNPSSDKFEEVQTLLLQYEFDKEIKIEKNRLKNEDSDTEEGPNPFAINYFENINLSLSQDKDRSGDTFMALNRDFQSNKFDQAHIPRGLVFFTKVTELLTKRLALSFSYKVFEFKEENSFQYIGENRRKAIIVELMLANPIYIIEVDSSDNKFISTLLMTNLNVGDKQEFFDLVFSELSKSNGAWPKDAIELYADYRLVKHPRRSKAMTQTEKFDNDAAQKYIERFAGRLAGVLR